MRRREFLGVAATAAIRGAAAPAPAPAPVVNGAEHAWVLHDARFRIDPAIASCPASLPKHEYSAEYLLGEMRSHGVDHVVISHVCYYGRNNAYPSHVVKTWSGKFAAIGLLVGHRLHPPADRENPARLERLVKEDGLVGLRLSPIYDPEARWLDDPVCYPLWKNRRRISAARSTSSSPPIRSTRWPTWPSAFRASTSSSIIWP